MRRAGNPIESPYGWSSCWMRLRKCGTAAVFVDVSDQAVRGVPRGNPGGNPASYAGRSVKRGIDGCNRAAGGKKAGGGDAHPRRKLRERRPSRPLIGNVREPWARTDRGMRLRSRAGGREPRATRVGSRWFFG
jgi:hypothetical protein